MTARATNPQDGTTIAYDDLGGDGPAVVLLHGTATMRVLWPLLGYTADLAPGRRLLLPDARGHGESDHPTQPDRYAMELLVQDVLAVLDDAGVEAAHVVGYSFGARIGLGLGTSAPERVLSLALGAGSHRPQRGSLDRVFFPGFADVLELEGVEGFLAGWERHLGVELPAAATAVFRAADPQALVPYARRTDEEPGFPDEALRALARPVLLFAGEHDTERLADCRAMVDLLPEARLEVVPGADHLTTLTQVDVVSPLLRDWLTTQSRTAPA